MEQFSLTVYVLPIVILKSTVKLLHAVVLTIYNKNVIIGPRLAGIPKGIDIEKLQTMLERIPGVMKVHNLRVWSLSMDKPALSAHIVIGESMSEGVILARFVGIFAGKKYFLPVGGLNRQKVAENGKNENGHLAHFTYLLKPLNTFIRNT